MIFYMKWFVHIKYINKKKAHILLLYIDTVIFLYIILKTCKLVILSIKIVITLEKQNIILVVNIYDIVNVVNS